MIIHGVDVFCVWCDSAELIKWDSEMELEEIRAEVLRKDAEILQLRRALEFAGFMTIYAFCPSSLLLSLLVLFSTAVFQHPCEAIQHVFPPTPFHCPI
jgi:hypothetical protein